MFTVDVKQLYNKKSIRGAAILDRPLLHMYARADVTSIQTLYAFNQYAYIPNKHELYCCNYNTLNPLTFLTFYYMYLSRAVVRYRRKYVHEVLVNRLGGLSLLRKSVVKLTDRPDMTLDVYRGRKTTKQQINNMYSTYQVTGLRPLINGRRSAIKVIHFIQRSTQFRTVPSSEQSRL